MTARFDHAHGSSETMGSTTRPLVSVVIPTKNSVTTLRRTIDSIRHQTYGQIEIIVVDNFSFDQTPRLAGKLGARVFSAGSERSAQVNFGASKARGKYIYRIDSDIFLEPTVIEECVRRCEEENFAAVAVHNTSDPSVSFWAAVRKLERDMYADDTINIGANFVRKDIFLALGGFDEKLVAGEDYDFQLRLSKARYRYARVKAQEIHLGEPRSLREIVTKHYYYGKTLRGFLKKDTKDAPILLSPVRAAYLRHWKRWFGDPRFLAGFLLYQIIRYDSALLGLIRTLEA